MRFVLRRLGFFVVTLWACLTLNFILPQAHAGKPRSLDDGQVPRQGQPAAVLAGARERRSACSTHARACWSQYVDYLRTR